MGLLGGGQSPILSRSILPRGAVSQNVPFLVALKASPIILELLLLFITKLGEAGVVPHVPSINIHCIRVVMLVVLVLVLVLADA